MPIKKIFHWGPILAFLIIAMVSFTTIISMELWLSIRKSKLGLLNFIIYNLELIIMIYNFFCAIFQGPGYVDLNWKPNKSQLSKLFQLGFIQNEDDLKNVLQYCEFCKGYKAPRSHHCRKCNRCVLKMDHHCPWINNCCGHENHLYFTLFLFFCVIGAIHSFVILSITLYKAYYVVWYFYNTDRRNLVYLSFKFFMAIVISIGITISVIIGVGGLLFIQIRIIAQNMTLIEKWIVTKAKIRNNEKYIYPFDLGLIQNFKTFFFDNQDGYTWKTVDGLNEYSFTYEQVQQKILKRKNSKHYLTINDYNGQWFPIFSQGFWTCINFPFRDEKRIKLVKDDVIIVTRSKKYWLYGEVQYSNNKINYERNKENSVNKNRGWFPRNCVVELTLSDTLNSNEYKKNK